MRRLVIAVLFLLMITASVVIGRSSLFAYIVEYRSAAETSDVAEDDVEKSPQEPVQAKDVVAHVETPESVRAIYMTSCVVGTPSFRDKLVNMIDATELNSVIIDVKDYTGTLSFKPESEELLPLWENGRCGTSQMREFIEELHEKDVYVIARITVFQDPYYAEENPQWAVQKASDGSVWRDGKGLAFIDVGAREAWEHTIEIAKESYAVGFDELNFDYVRYPSDGDMQDIYFPHTKSASKADTLEKFFKHLDETLGEEVPGAVTSADLFGMTTTNYDDLSIGQILEKAMPYFDYVAPMVYPSHYPAGFNGWSDPNTVPGPLIKFVMDAAVERATADSTTIETIGSERIECKAEEGAADSSEEDSTSEGEETELAIAASQSVATSEAETEPLPPECKETLYTKEVYDADKIRPWLQDFDYGGDYDAADVRAQIQATYDAGLDSWMLWDPGNTYTPEALEASN